MRRLLILATLGWPVAAVAQFPPSPIPTINATLRGIDHAARSGETGLEMPDADPLVIAAPAALLPGGGCYAGDDLARAAPYEPVYKDGALVCEDRRTVVPR